jgi:hypothetical protein
VRHAAGPGAAPGRCRPPATSPAFAHARLQRRARTGARPHLAKQRGGISRRKRDIGNITVVPWQVRDSECVSTSRCRAARQADVGEPALLLQAAGIIGRALAREHALLQADEEDHGNSRPLALCRVINCTPSSAGLGLALAGFSAA